MDYENKKNQQEEGEGQEQILEQDPFNPEKPLDEIKNVAKEKGESSLAQASENLEENLENFSEAVGGEATLVSELESIKDEAKEKITLAGGEFGQSLEAVKDENAENKAEEKESTSEQKEKALSGIRSSYAEQQKLVKEIKKTKDPEKLKQLQDELGEKTESLKSAEAMYHGALGTEIAERMFNNPEVSQLELMTEMVLPGLETIQAEKEAALLSEKQHSALEKTLHAIGKYVPKNELLRSIAVSTIITIASSPIHIATGGSTALLHAGAKILRAVAGVTIGQKIAEHIDKKIENAQNKKRQERLSKGLDASLDDMIKLAEDEMKIAKKQANIRKFIKTGAHVIFAGGVIGGIELGEAFVHGMGKSAGEAAAGHITEVFAASGKHAGTDIAGDYVAHHASEKHEEVKNAREEKMAA